ncbi:hypothetical protein QFC22_001660 [Naganishia vaughanmartiniae]|uniref:Uncharacterized protein n=1 Tax=Naganishia vaughanmartiniae TaxID=1424756 RepID=A0ACC2XF54_9TREE|nr:hypothetical protein QFC22_001660 [Naganishia vaughanmartiniae]
MGKRIQKNKRRAVLLAKQELADVPDSPSTKAAEVILDQKTTDACEGYALPLDVIGIVANLLISDNAYATCASLNVTSRAVHEETQQTLWRTVVHWGFDASKVAAASSGSKNRGRNQKRAPRRTAEELMLASLVQLKDSDGAKYTEYIPQDLGRRLFRELINAPRRTPCRYLMFPGVPAGETAVSLLQEMANLTTISSRMVRLKVIMNLTEATKEEPTTGVIVFQTGRFRQGSEDVIMLAGTLKIFYKAAHSGHQQTKNITVLFVPLHHSVSAARAIPIKNRWDYTTGMNHLLSCVEFRKPEMGALMSDDDTIADTLLDIIYWMSRSDGDSERRENRVLLYDVTLEQLLVCVRAIRKAISIHPAMATVNWYFMTIETPIAPSSLKEMNKIVAVLRGTYLRAAREIDVGRLGKTEIRWTINHFANDYWKVTPTGAPKNALVTSMCHDQPFDGFGAKVLHVDEWPTPVV